MGNSHSETQRKQEDSNKHLFSSWLKKWNEENPEKGDIYGLIDISKLTLPESNEESVAMVEQKHERRRRNCGKIVINEEVPQKIMDLLIKLSYYENDDVLNNIWFSHDFNSYYEEIGFLPTLSCVVAEAKMHKDFTALPILLLLDFITVKKMLHIRYKEVKDFCTAFDSYLYILRQIEYRQNKKSTSLHIYKDFVYKHKLPITKEEIHSIIEFFYMVLDKNHLSKYKEENTNLNHVDVYRNVL